jgi:hypothetical protein
VPVRKAVRLGESLTTLGNIQKIALRIGVSDFPGNLGRKEKPSESRMPNGSFTIDTYEYRNGMNCFCTPETVD